MGFDSFKVSPLNKQIYFNDIASAHNIRNKNKNSFVEFSSKSQNITLNTFMVTNLFQMSLPLNQLY